MGYSDRWNGSNCTFEDIMKAINMKEIEEIMEFVTLTALMFEYSVTYEFVPNSMYVINFYKTEGRFSSLDHNINFIVHPTKKYLKEINYSSQRNSVKSGFTFDFMAPVNKLKKEIIES